MNNDRVSIHVCTKDRHSEVACLLVSLRNQTYQNWDLVLVDESQTPLDTHTPSMFLLNRLRQENHKVVYCRNTISRGVCHARNLCIENDIFDNEYTLRVDDDVVLDVDYIEKLLDVIKAGYDIASGVTPLMNSPELVRDATRLNGTVNKIVWDEKGNIIHYADDCGRSYYTPATEILPTDHFRSCALYKSELHQHFKYETNLSPVGFREESFFSLRARWLGYKIAVDLTAKAWHFVTPSGGCRYSNYAELVRQDDETFKKWAQKMFIKNGGAPNEN